MLWSVDLIMKTPRQDPAYVLNYNTGSCRGNVNFTRNFSCIQWGVEDTGENRLMTEREACAEIMMRLQEKSLELVRVLTQPWITLYLFFSSTRHHKNLKALAHGLIVLNKFYKPSTKYSSGDPVPLSRIPWYCLFSLTVFLLRPPRFVSALRKFRSGSLLDATGVRISVLFGWRNDTL